MRELVAEWKEIETAPEIKLETNSIMRFFMKAANFANVAITLILVGCAGDSSTAPTGGGPQPLSAGPRLTSTQSAALSSENGWVAATAGPKQLIYVDYLQRAPTTHLNIYSEKSPTHLVTDIDGGHKLTVPTHMAVDGGGNVYLANSQGSGNTAQGEILLYPAGSTAPTKTLHIGNNRLWFIQGVCVRAGNVYGVIQTPLDQAPEPVYEWAHGATLPTSTIYSYPATYYPKACAVDSIGNLYVLYDNSGQSYIDEFVSGSNTPQTLGIVLGNGADLAIDPSDNLIVSGVFGGSQGIWVFPPGQTIPSKSFDAGGAPWGFALDSSGKYIFVVELCANQCTQSEVLTYDYTSGSQVGSFPASGKKHSIQFIAVTPRAKQ
jgi:hypothetical protein